jgi:hypothetical protein
MMGILETKLPTGGRSKKTHQKELRSPNISDNTPISDLTYEHIRDSWLLFMRNLWWEVIPKQCFPSDRCERGLLNIHVECAGIGWRKLPSLEGYQEVRGTFAKSVEEIVFVGMTDFLDDNFAIITRIVNEYGK